MNNDLISREALKESIRKRLGISSLKYLTEQEKVIVNEIDSAPTVEPTFKPMVEVKFDKEQMQELVDKAKAEVLASIERPQSKWGKWIITEIRCPICLEYFQPDYYSMEELNECPSCGVYLKGGAKE